MVAKESSSVRNFSHHQCQERHNVGVVQPQDDVVFTIAKQCFLGNERIAKILSGKDLAVASSSYLFVFFWHRVGLVLLKDIWYGLRWSKR